MNQTKPRISGALWWLTDEFRGWTEDQWRASLDSQQEVGFDLLWLINVPAWIKDVSGSKSIDFVLTEADRRKMRVIVDLPCLPNWYGVWDATTEIREGKAFARDLVNRFGQHPSLWGWYLNYETYIAWREQSDWLRHVWTELTTECKRVAPKMKVTISPFFLLDPSDIRHFPIAKPDEYRDWWAETIKVTGIDIVMLQDSGEHQSFFTLDERRPYLAAMRDACRDAGKTFWANVETGECVLPGWDEHKRRYDAGKDPLHDMSLWKFTPMDKLKAKIDLAAEYGEDIVTWGYWEYWRADGNEVQKANYEAYKDDIGK